MGIFDSLHIGVSGMMASQAGINTTSHNITNVNTEGYSRQRTEQKVNMPIHEIPGDVGNGVHVDRITRIHDEFAYSRMKSASAKMEFHEFSKDTLQEITNLMPDLSGNGVANDLKQFFNNWSNVALYPGDNAQKVLLVQGAQTLSETIKETKVGLEDAQVRLNNNFKASVDEVNKIAEEIASINKDINRVESTFESNANDFRDHRDALELRLAKLIDATVFKGKLHTDNSLDRSMTDQGKDYNINIAGFNIVDGASFHPLHADDGSSTTKLNSLFFVDQDNQKVDVTSKIRSGKIGAIISLRGDGVDANGKATNSKIQGYIDNLDSLAKGLVESVNNIYAKSPQDEIVSQPLTLSKDLPIAGDDAHIKTGSFDVVVYNTLGEAVATRTVTIDKKTAIDDGTPRSIIEQINQNKDDNGDNDGSNDVDDFFEASFGVESFSLKPKQSGYTVAINDHGTNFAGVIGANTFFRGDSASNIDVASKLKNDPSKVQAYQSPIDGNNEVASEMVTLQHATLDFDTPSGGRTQNSIEGFYRTTTAKIATDAGDATSHFEATQALHRTIKEQMDSVSGVDMDEELVNLMKYQTVYQASAKVITTIDEMVNTLLGLK